MREYFMKTNRIGFSIWKDADKEYAQGLWGSREVTKYICATGSFTAEEIQQRLLTEIHNQKQYNIQYWPIFELETNEFIGACGLRPFSKEGVYELGFYLKKEYWGKGYAQEAATAVITYAFNTFPIHALYTGHHPDNNMSRKVIHKLGFQYIGDIYYPPTGLYHPSYERYRV